MHLSIYTWTKAWGFQVVSLTKDCSVATVASRRVAHVASERGHHVSGRASWSSSSMQCPGINFYYYVLEMSIIDYFICSFRKPPQYVEVSNRIFPR